MLEKSCRGHNDILRENLKFPPLRRFLILFLAQLDLFVVSKNSRICFKVRLAFYLIVSELVVYIPHVTFVVAA